MSIHLKLWNFRLILCLVKVILIHIVLLTRLGFDMVISILMNYLLLFRGIHFKQTLGLVKKLTVSPPKFE